MKIIPTQFPNMALLKSTTDADIGLNYWWNKSKEQKNLLNEYEMREDLLKNNIKDLEKQLEEIASAMNLDKSEMDGAGFFGRACSRLMKKNKDLELKVKELEDYKFRYESCNK